MEKINKLAKEFLKKVNLLKKVEDNKAVELWPKVVGEIISSRTRACAVYNGILKVAVGNSSWSQELSYLKKDILERLNEKMGNNNQVADIRFFVENSLYSKRKTQADNTNKLEENDSLEELADEEEKVIEKATSAVLDPLLREKVAKAIKSTYSLAKKKNSM